MNVFEPASKHSSSVLQAFVLHLPPPCWTCVCCASGPYKAVPLLAPWLRCECNCVGACVHTAVSLATCSYSHCCCCCSEQGLHTASTAGGSVGALGRGVRADGGGAGGQLRAASSIQDRLKGLAGDCTAAAGSYRVSSGRTSCRQGCSCLVFL